MARNKKGRKEKRKVYILVEGETEQKYFDFLRQKLRLSNVKIRTLILNNSGRTWIDRLSDCYKMILNLVAINRLMFLLFLIKMKLL